MYIEDIKKQKKKYIKLLLLADEQESMIDRYLDRGAMYVLQDGGIIGVCIVTDEGNETLEIKNIAIDPPYQNIGYGQKLIDLICEKYKDRYKYIQLGTGDIQWIISFYEKCGFQRSHIIKNFFTDNYDHPMFEDGKQLIDMIYLKKEL